MRGRWIISQEAFLRDVRTSRCSARCGLRATRVGEASHPGPQLFRRSRTRGGRRRQIVVVSSDEEPLVPARNVVVRVQATQIDPEVSQTIPSTIPATPESLAHAGREIPSVPLDVLNALEHDLAPHPVQHVEETQLDAPSFVHATQFDALLGDTDADEEALPVCRFFPPPVIHHTMFSPSDPETEASEGGSQPVSGVRTGETPFGSCFQCEPTSSGGWRFS